MNKWFLIKVSVNRDDGGIIKRRKEEYVLNAVSYGDAEKQIYKRVLEDSKGEFDVRAIQKKMYEEIFLYEDAEIWYEVRVDYTFSDDSGKDVVKAIRFLVNASSVNQACARIMESTKDIQLAYEITHISKTQILEIFTGANYQNKLIPASKKN